jgi:hypothetical protein
MTTEQIHKEVIKQAIERLQRGQSFWMEWNDGFEHPIGVRPLDRTDPWVAQCNITYYLGGLPLKIPKGFACDGASVPRLFWLILGFLPTDPALYAAFPHDYIYRTQTGYERILADGALLAGLLSLNPYTLTEDEPETYGEIISDTINDILHQFWIFRSYMMYYGVRFGGWITWRRHKKRLQREREANQTPANGS